jgi:hypothetical protein
MTVDEMEALLIRCANRVEQRGLILPADFDHLLSSVAAALLREQQEGFARSDMVLMAKDARALGMVMAEAYEDMGFLSHKLRDADDEDPT